MDAPLAYQVSYSGRVRDALRDLVLRALEVGLGAEILAAVREIDTRLHIYPQFGQPLRDLSVESAQLWIGVVAPVVVQYVLVESRRQVMVVQPLRPVSGYGL